VEKASEEDLKLTVVVSPREGHQMAEASLRSVLADDSAPFDLIYLDVLSPPATAAAINALCAERGFQVIRHDAWIAPAEARKNAMTRVATPYVVFIDNDAFVEPGAFGRLLACAEETGAGLVGPLYLQGPADRREIHMAGGKLVRNDAGSIVAEQHILAGAPKRSARRLRRSIVDYLEFHCVLARSDLAREPGVISDDVLLVHEHIHISLAARERGFSVWLEPAASIYFYYLPPPLGDLAFFRRRWDEAGCERSLAAFCRRWPVAEPDRFLADVRSFVRHKRQQSDALIPGAGPSRPEQPMVAADLAQTRTALREQTIARGYVASDVRKIEWACDHATRFCDGRYRADGRPFLNHVIGTASALVRYGFRPDVVAAGLLHAAYTHRPPWFASNEISKMLASFGETDALVRGLPDAKAQLAAGVPAKDLTLPQACALAIEAANEADMLLSGEYRASGRPAMLTAEGGRLLTEVLGQMEASGLAETARSPPGEGLQGPVLGIDARHVSFRLDHRKRRRMSDVWAQIRRFGGRVVRRGRREAVRMARAASLERNLKRL
jgi:hypothetical protein